MPKINLDTTYNFTEMFLNFVKATTVSDENPLTIPLNLINMSTSEEKESGDLESLKILVG